MNVILSMEGKYIDYTGVRVIQYSSQGLGAKPRRFNVDQPTGEARALPPRVLLHHTRQ